MEETLVPKRPREEPQVEEKDLNFEQDYSSKRQKPYTHILSLLDSEEEDSSTQDLSPLITTLQQEITSASNNEISQDSLLVSPTQENDQATLTTIHALENGTAPTSPPQVVKEEEEEEESDKERVMRHLLQASDDELGIPSSGDDGVFGFVAEDGFNSEHGFSSLCDKLWELEDERANYYAFLQSELFLGGH